MSFRILVNSGPAKIYLQQTAEALEQRNILLGITGSLIFPRNSLLRRFNLRSKHVNKILRRSEGINDPRLIQRSWIGEFFWQIGIALQKKLRAGSTIDFIFWSSAVSFSWTSRKLIKRLGRQENSIYHVRSGFGGRSIELARKMGYKIIVDHSIAHPSFLRNIEQDDKKKPTRKFALNPEIEKDLISADLVLVNSEFVKETFMKTDFEGIVKTAIPPIEESFTRMLRMKDAKRDSITFIGRCEHRKGIDRVYDIIAGLNGNFKVNIIGNWDLRDLAIKNKLEVIENVSMSSFVDRDKVAQILSETKVFLFPSRAEGAARVVSEALHAGCVVFTTHESGIPIPTSVGYTINHLSNDQVRDRIVEIMNDENNSQYIANSRKYIKELESSYLPSLLKIYEEVKNR
jgi:glycosyltransferase involved in cell wall biosynthesis